MLGGRLKAQKKNLLQLWNYRDKTCAYQCMWTLMLQVFFCPCLQACKKVSEFVPLCLPTCNAGFNRTDTVPTTVHDAPTHVRTPLLKTVLRVSLITGTDIPSLSWTAWNYNLTWQCGDTWQRTTNTVQCNLHCWRCQKPRLTSKAHALIPHRASTMWRQRSAVSAICDHCAQQVMYVYVHATCCNMQSIGNHKCMMQHNKHVHDQ